MSSFISVATTSAIVVVGSGGDVVLLLVVVVVMLVSFLFAMYCSFTIIFCARTRQCH